MFNHVESPPIKSHSRLWLKDLTLKEKARAEKRAEIDRWLETGRCFAKTTTEDRLSKIEEQLREVETKIFQLKHGENYGSINKILQNLNPEIEVQILETQEDQIEYVSADQGELLETAFINESNELDDSSAVTKGKEIEVLNLRDKIVNVNSLDELTNFGLQIWYQPYSLFGSIKELVNVEPPASANQYTISLIIDPPLFTSVCYCLPNSASPRDLLSLSSAHASQRPMPWPRFFASTHQRLLLLPQIMCARQHFSPLAICASANQRSLTRLPMLCAKQRYPVQLLTLPAISRYVTIQSCPLDNSCANQRISEYPKLFMVYFDAELYFSLVDKNSEFLNSEIDQGTVVHCCCNFILSKIEEFNSLRFFAENNVVIMTGLFCQVRDNVDHPFTLFFIENHVVLPQPKKPPKALNGELLLTLRKIPLKLFLRELRTVRECNNILLKPSTYKKHPTAPLLSFESEIEHMCPIAKLEGLLISVGFNLFSLCHTCLQSNLSFVPKTKELVKSKKRRGEVVKLWFEPPLGQSNIESFISSTSSSYFIYDSVYKSHSLSEQDLLYLQVRRNEANETIRGMKLASHLAMLIAKGLKSIQILWTKIFREGEDDADYPTPSNFRRPSPLKLCSTGVIAILLWPRKGPPWPDDDPKQATYIYGIISSQRINNYTKYYFQVKSLNDQEANYPGVTLLIVPRNDHRRHGKPSYGSSLIAQAAATQAQAALPGQRVLALQIALAKVGPREAQHASSRIRIKAQRVPARVQHCPHANLHSRPADPFRSPALISMPIQAHATSGLYTQLQLLPCHTRPPDQAHLRMPHA